jgi:hypothetical protein
MVNLPRILSAQYYFGAFWVLLGPDWGFVSFSWCTIIKVISVLCTKFRWCAYFCGHMCLSGITVLPFSHCLCICMCIVMWFKQWWPMGLLTVGLGLGLLYDEWESVIERIFQHGHWTIYVYHIQQG